MLAPQLAITECPRDAMQGFEPWIDTELKFEYLKSIFDCQFPFVDFASFVSPKAIPQLRDSAELAERLLPHKGNCQTIAIVPNARGASTSVQFPIVDWLGYPFSVSEIFQKRNLGMSISDSYAEVEKVANIAFQASKKLTIYLSMAFGNPYGEDIPSNRITDIVERLSTLGVSWFSLADTTGVGNPDLIEARSAEMLSSFPQHHWSLHLHATPASASKLIQAGYQAGIRHFDGAIGGFGGCPFAADALTGNLPTEALLAFASQQNLSTGVHLPAFHHSQAIAKQVFAIH